MPACTHTKKQNCLNQDRTLFLPGADVPHVYVGALTLCCFHSLICTQSFWRVLTASVTSCMEIKSAPSVAYQLILAEFGGRCWKVMLGVWCMNTFMHTCKYWHYSLIINHWHVNTGIKDCGRTHTLAHWKSSLITIMDSSYTEQIFPQNKISEFCCTPFMHIIHTNM